MDTGSGPGMTGAKFGSRQYLQISAFWASIRRSPFTPDKALTSLNTTVIPDLIRDPLGRYYGFVS